MNVINDKIPFYGQDLIIETGKLAKQADGSVTVQHGNNVVLATVVAATKIRENQDFFPLTVDYRERVNAAGRFRGGYLKREARSSQKETLVSRLVDRSLRPLFGDGFLYEVLVEIAVISTDGKYDPDMMAILAASSALTLSSISFLGPVGGVRVARVDGNFVINPSNEEREKSDIDLTMAGNKNGVMMVEGHSDFISEEDLINAIYFGNEGIKKQLELQEKLAARAAIEKDVRELYPLDQSFVAEVNDVIDFAELRNALYVKEKKGRDSAIKEIWKTTTEKLIGESEEKKANEDKYKAAFKEVQKKLLRSIILEEGIRADGRKTDEVRPIWIETGVLPMPHGSAVFTRGETQALAVATLGSGKDAQRVEEFGEDLEENFYLHYTFPGFSVGEVKGNRGPSRREIGHGKLAERAIAPIIPSKDEFPYTIRVTSDILESNGSSSMASVCGGCLCLMDAGVPIKEPVSGIAMGLIQEGDKVQILSDILGLEDALGDMDFKLAGGKSGITSFQMDIKIQGLSREIMQQALTQANAGRMHILEKMNEVLPAPKQLSVNAPRIYTINIPTDKIGLVIGPGGKNIRELSDKYKVAIEIKDDGSIFIHGEEAPLAEKCVDTIKEMTAEIEVGKIYEGTVKTVVAFGAFIECIPGKEGLLHISRIAHERVNRVEDHFKEGDKVEVKCVDIDDKGRVVLSRKDILPKPEAE